MGGNQYTFKTNTQGIAFQICLVEVQVEGGSLLGFGGANPCTEERFDSGRYTTYYGRAQAVVRAEKADVVRIKVSGGGMKNEACINVLA